LLDEDLMVNSIERLGDVESDQAHPRRWFVLVKAICNSSNNCKEGSGGRPKGSKTMLGERKRKRRRIDEGKKEALKDLNSRREKRDGAVTGALVKRLTRLRDGDGIGFFPNSRELSVIDRKIEEFG
jgi:hypothetical protein